MIRFRFVTLYRGKRAFSNSTFAGVLQQFSNHKDKTGAMPCDPEISSSSQQVQPPKPAIPDDQEDYLDEPPDDGKLKSEVVTTINSLLEAQNIWAGNKFPDKASLDDESLTPAQRFYLENKELLVNRMVDYSISQAHSEWEKATKDIEDDWAFYRDPIVRPSRGKLWPVSPLSSSGEDAEENGEHVLSQEGRMPSVNELIEFLEKQHVGDVIAVDLENAGRRDIGEYALIGTVKSHAHGDRVGKLSCRSVNKLKIENVKTFSDSTPGQEWIVVRLGSFVVHLMTATERSRYSLEDLYMHHGPESSVGEDLLPTEAPDLALEISEVNPS